MRKFILWCFSLLLPLKLLGYILGPHSSFIHHVFLSLPPFLSKRGFLSFVCRSGAHSIIVVINISASRSMMHIFVIELTEERNICMKNILIGKSSKIISISIKSEIWALCRLRTSKFNNTKSVAVVLISNSRIKGYDNKLLNSFRYCLAHFPLACIYYFMLNINKRMCLEASWAFNVWLRILP